MKTFIRKSKNILIALSIIPYVLLFTYTLSLFVDENIYNNGVTQTILTVLSVGGLFLSPFIFAFYKALNKDTDKKADRKLLFLSFLVCTLVSAWLGMFIVKISLITLAYGFSLSLVQLPIFCILTVQVLFTLYSYLEKNKEIKVFFHSLSNAH